MEERKLVPKRRFREFENKWKLQCFKEMADYRHGKAHERNVVVNGNYVIVNSKFISTNGKTEKFSNLQIEPLHEDEITFVLSDIPNGKALAKTYLISKNNRFTLNQRILGITPKRTMDSYFLKEYMNRHSYFLKFDDGANQTNLSNQDLENFKLRCPNIKEQQKIGEFFKVLDERIASQERKTAKVKALKDAYLTEMFPQEGETVPKRRFKGFEGEWKAFKLKDLGMFTSNGVNKKVNKNEMLVNLLNYMDVYKRKKITNENRHTLMQVTANLDQIKKNSVEKNDVFFTPSSETPDDIGRVMVIEESLDNTVYSYHLMRFRPYRNILHSIFPNYVFDTFYFRKQLEFAAQGVQRYVLNRDAFEELLVQLPRINEQKAISDFFRTLDDQIEVEEKKLDKLQKMKEAYLEEMFL